MQHRFFQLAAIFAALSIAQFAGAETERKSPPIKQLEDGHAIVTATVKKLAPHPPYRVSFDVTIMIDEVVIASVDAKCTLKKGDAITVFMTKPSGTDEIPDQTDFAVGDRLALAIRPTDTGDYEQCPGSREPADKLDGDRRDILKKLRPLAALSPDDRWPACLKVIADPKSPVDFRMEVLMEFNWYNRQKLSEKAQREVVSSLSKNFLDPKNGLPDNELSTLDWTISELDPRWTLSDKRREILTEILFTPPEKIGGEEFINRCNNFRWSLPDLIVQDVAGILPRIEKAMDDRRFPMRLRCVMLMSICQAYCRTEKSDAAILRAAGDLLPSYIENAEARELCDLCWVLGYLAKNGAETYKRDLIVEKSVRDALGVAVDRLRQFKDEGHANFVKDALAKLPPLEK